VGGLSRRVAKIEERRTPPKLRPRSEAQRRAYWEARQKRRYTEHQPRSVFHARDFINHRRLVGWLGRYNAESMIDAIVGDTELSRPMVEHTVYRAIYDGEAGLQHMQTELPDKWADAFRAADEWREKLASVPVEVAAVWVRAHRTLIKERGSQARDEMLALDKKHMSPYGITEELLERVCGPDRDLLPAQEAHWMVYSPIAGVLRSDWAWEIQQRVEKLDEIGGKS
jgi:hypothetical protein